MMPGYHLQQHEPAIPPGERPAQHIGFLDFLREICGDDPAVPRFWRVTVVGLEEVLFAAGQQVETMTSEILMRLRAAAPHLEKRLADVTVLFRGRLVRGDDLWSEYRGTRLPIGHIFGSPTPQSTPEGQRTFFANFNLTHGG